jgi:hypothetical protein
VLQGQLLAALHGPHYGYRKAEAFTGVSMGTQSINTGTGCGNMLVPQKGIRVLFFPLLSFLFTASTPEQAL